MEWNNSFTELLEIQCVTKSAGGLGLKRMKKKEAVLMQVEVTHGKVFIIKSQGNEDIN